VIEIPHSRFLHLLDECNGQSHQRELGPGPRIRQLFSQKTSSLPEVPLPCRESEGDTVFKYLLFALGLPLGSVPLKGIEEDSFSTSERSQCVDWYA
jgi:hypothetical protein